MNLRGPIDPRSGFKLQPAHREDCWCEHDADGMTFIVYRGTVYLDRIGRKNGHQMWLAFACNDPNCPAQMLVRWDVLSKFVTAGGASMSSRENAYGWVRPLKDGAFQYFGKCPEGGWVWGASRNRFEAVEIVHNFLADHGHEKAPIEQKRPYGTWADKLGVQT